jgi:hypothetical protein
MARVLGGASDLKSDGGIGLADGIVTHILRYFVRRLAAESKTSRAHAEVLPAAALSISCRSSGLSRILSGFSRRSRSDSFLRPMRKV